MYYVLVLGVVRAYLRLGRRVRRPTCLHLFDRFALSPNALIADAEVTRSRALLHVPWGIVGVREVSAMDQVESFDVYWKWPMITSEPWIWPMIAPTGAKWQWYYRLPKRSDFKPLQQHFSPAV